MTDQTPDWILLNEYTEHGSQAAFSRLVERHLASVHRMCRRELRDIDLAEDVTQVVFLILAKKAKSLSRHQPLTPWLYSVSRMACQNARKSQQRRQRLEEIASKVETEPFATSYIDHGDHIDAGMRALSSRDQEALILRYWENLNVAEIARRIEVSEAAAQKRLTRAVDRLRNYLKRHGVTVDTAGLTTLMTPDGGNIEILHLLARITLPTTSSPQTTALLKGTLDTMRLYTIRKAAIAGIIAAVSLSVGTYMVVADAPNTSTTPARSTVQRPLPQTDANQVYLRTKFFIPTNADLDSMLAATVGPGDPPSVAGQTGDASATFTVIVNRRTLRPSDTAKALSDLPVVLGSGRIVPDQGGNLLARFTRQSAVITNPSLLIQNGNTAGLTMSSRVWKDFPPLSTLNLNITPTVNSNGMVTLTIAAEFKDLHPISTPGASATVRVKPISVTARPGDTVALTGLISQSNTPSAKALVIFMTI